MNYISHIGLVDAHAECNCGNNGVDFLCDEGTPVRAALDGTVIELRTNVTRNYNKHETPTEEQLPESERGGNYILLKHPHDEISIYAHLKRSGILVKQGQKVKQGEKIGYTGNTGWSIKPHLHFMVFKFLGTETKSFRSLEPQFKS